MFNHIFSASITFLQQASKNTNSQAWLSMHSTFKKLQPDCGLACSLRVRLMSMSHGEDSRVRKRKRQAIESHTSKGQKSIDHFFSPNPGLATQSPAAAPDRGNGNGDLQTEDNLHEHCPTEATVIPSTLDRMVNIPPKTCKVTNSSYQTSQSNAVLTLIPRCTRTPNNRYARSGLLSESVSKAYLPN